NMQRLGLKSIHTIETDALEYTDEPFDRVLADVPCIGSGTLSKKPDIKWKKDIFDLRALNDLQYNLLSKAGSLVKLGGIVVYSTCSIEPEENFVIVERFLSENSNFKLESAKSKFPDDILDEHGCIQTYPHRHKMDGAFAAKLIKLV
ncbi:MAG: RsmB/NOP family class I SAM-dependent RNA methyltransferase, partial [Ignavibacteriaceae bacterium]